MKDRLLPRWMSWSLEVALLATLAGSWLLGWTATRSNLDALPAGTRNVTLNFWSTSSELWLVPLFVVAIVALLLARHRWPESSFWVGLALVTLYAQLFPLVDLAEFGSTLATLILAGWAILSTRHLPVVALGALVAAGLATFPYYEVQQNLAVTGQSQSPLLASISETVGRILIMAMALLVAWLARRMRAQTSELAERNLELVQRRGEAAQTAIVDERLRISRELHDVVAHHITAMTVHAGGASRALSSNIEAAESSLSQIAASGRDAINDLQRMLGFLRGQEEPELEPRSPSPSLRHLDRLTASFGDDIEIDLAVTGPVSSLPASVDLSAYRIVQEALTNVVKHSSSRAASVEVQIEPNTMTITVDNDAQIASSAPLTDHGTGHGLIGMHERALLHAGSLEAGPKENGGWRVHAVLRHAQGERK